MDNFITVYFTQDYEPSEQEIEYFEKLTNREISVGDGFINVYTQDKSLIQDLVDVIGEHCIQEVAC